LRARTAILLTLLPLLSACGKPGTTTPHATNQNVQPIGDTLTFTVVPYEAAQRLNEEYTPMAQYLAHKLGKKQGIYVPVVDYAGVLAALESGQVDVAYLSSFPYALATSRMRLYPLAMPWVLGSLDYRGIIFVRKESPIKTIQDLKGHTVAFGDPTSTSGYLLPRALLERNGVPLSSLKHYYNAGDANVVVKAVETGAADAGAAYESVFQVAYRGHPEKAQMFRIIARTEAIPNGIYVARGNLDPADVERLRKAFLAMNTDPEGRAAMLKAPNDKIVPADDHLFDHVRETARILNLNLEQLEKKK